MSEGEGVARKGLRVGMVMGVVVESGGGDGNGDGW